VKKKSFFAIFSTYFFLAFILGFLLWWKGGLQSVEGSNKETIVFVIDKGEGVSEITAKLKEQGLIKNQLSFKVWVVVAGIAKKIKAGSYYLSRSMTTPEIASILTKGAADRWLTIVEGLRAEQIGELLIKEGFAINPENWEKEIETNKLEGQLFPDSYLFPKSSTQAAILKIIRKNFQKKVIDGLKNELTASGKNQDFVLTLASLVEREAKTPQDRALVAGILLKRLENDWPLQVDATVQYAVASQKCSILKNQALLILKSPCDWWPRELTAGDLQIKSTYNTYIYHGLPPGPICNPGLSSIKAVLSPTQSPFWYYLSDKNGVIHYAKTDKEQSDNKEKYLK